MKTFKFKLYRSKRNKSLQRQIDVAGLAWNHCLALTKRYYRMYGRSVSESAVKHHLVKLKKRQPYAYLNELGSQALQDVVERLFAAYKRFFDSRKQGLKAGFPKFKKIRFTLKQSGYKLLDGNRITINKKQYRYFKSREIPGKIKTVTVKRDAVGDLWVCFAVQMDQSSEVLPRLGNAVGMDFGLKQYLTLSNGQTVDVPGFFKRHRESLKKANQRLSRKVKGSNNWYRAKDDLARLHRTIANQRNAWHWQLARELVADHALIGLETLNLKAMQRLWGKKISDYGFSDFVKILTHVASEVGTEVVQIDRWYASSQLCSACGHRWEGTKDLNVRSWQCPKCGQDHQRDINAAVNILTEALRLTNKDKTGGASSVTVRRSKTAI